MTEPPRPPTRRHALLALPALAAPVLPARGRSGWHSDFGAGLADWGRLRDGWGFHNHRFLSEAGVPGQVLRVALARGSIDPGSMRRRGLPASGTGFKAAVIAGGADAAQLRYRLRFAPGFDFVRGGKLPGLYAGSGPSGGRVPDGRDGCSFRLMWREQGHGEVYAYLPGLQRHGLSLLRGRFGFVPGRWHEVRQEVVLNTPGCADGRVSLWLDGTWAGTAEGLHMRDDGSLRLDGVFVDLFFGGNDDSWAARHDTHVDLAQFEVQAVDGQPVGAAAAPGKGC
jgi:hypothetical protein